MGQAPDVSPSAMTPPWPGDWSPPTAVARCSSPTQSPTRSPEWWLPSPRSIASPREVDGSSTSRWLVSQRGAQSRLRRPTRGRDQPPRRAPDAPPALPRHPDGTPPASCGSSAHEERAVPKGRGRRRHRSTCAAPTAVSPMSRRRFPRRTWSSTPTAALCSPGCTTTTSTCSPSPRHGHRSTSRRRRRRPISTRPSARPSDRRADRGCASSAITSRSTGRSIATASICWRQRVPSACSTAPGRCGCSTRLDSSRSARSTATVSSEGWTASRPGGCTGWTTSCDSASSSSRSTWPPLDASWPPTG